MSADVEEKSKLRKFFDGFWFLLWKDNSIKGWIFSVIFLLVFIKFIFFPVLSLITGTALPLAIVESCSMYHQDNLLSNQEVWWQAHEEKYGEFNITSSDFNNFPLKKGFNKGDILFITRATPDKIKVGDVIIFSASQRNPIIHRVVDIKQVGNERVFATMGDNNNGQLSFETRITESQLVGKASVKIAPYMGWVKLVFYDWKKPESEKGSCVEN